MQLTLVGVRSIDPPGADYISRVGIDLSPLRLDPLPLLLCLLSVPCGSF